MSFRKLDRIDQQEHLLKTYIVCAYFYLIQGPCLIASPKQATDLNRWTEEEHGGEHGGS